MVMLFEKVIFSMRRLVDVDKGRPRLCSVFLTGDDSRRKIHGRPKSDMRHVKANKVNKLNRKEKTGCKDSIERLFI